MAVFVSRNESSDRLLAREVLTLDRVSHRYQSVADEQAVLRVRLRDLAQDRVRYGYRRLHGLLSGRGGQ